MSATGQVKILPLQVKTLPLKAEIVPLKARMVSLKIRIEQLKAGNSAVTAALDALKAETTKKGELRINLPADVLFAFDKANIRPQAAKALRQVALVIRSRGARKVRIEGHSDAKGSDAYNQRLSLRRARSVRNWLVKSEGFDSRLFATKGFGETRPVAPNTNADGSDNPQGRERNRRVEIFVVPGI